jgi:hypothetical protein
MFFAIVKYGKIRSRPHRTNADGELNGDVLPRITIFSHESFGDLLSDIFLGRFISLSCLVDEIENLALLDNHCGLWGD